MACRQQFAALRLLATALISGIPLAFGGPAVAEDAPGSITVTQEEAIRLVLSQWEDVGRSSDTLYVRLNRYCYDEGRHVEKRCAGRFLIDNQGQWVLELERVRIGPDQQSQRKDASGQPYELCSDEPSAIICHDNAWITLFPDQRHYLKTIGNLPSTEEWLRQWRENGRSFQQSLGHSLLGFGCLHFDYFFRRTLLKPLQADLRSRFAFKVLKSEGARVWLEMKPKSGGFDAENFSSLQVIFNREVGRPVAARCEFPGNIELVYLFTEFETDVPILTGQDPFNPDLSGYQGETIELGAE